VVEALIKGGAFDCTGYPRKQMYRIMEGGLLKQAAKRQEERDAGQLSMFDVFEAEEHGFEDTTIEPPDGDEWDKGLKLAFEREVLGMYLSDHPLSGYADAMREHADMSLSSSDIPLRFEGWFAGMLSGVEIRPNKMGKMYARGQLEDLGANVKFVVFSKGVDKYKEFLENDKIVLMHGQYKREDGDVTLIVNEIKALPGGDVAAKPKLLVSVGPEQMSDRGTVEEFRRVLTLYPGRSVVELHLFEPVSKTTTVAVLPEQVNPDGEGLLERLETLLGAGVAKVTR
jgi:DNA polymerase-3 subunit alpha